MSNYNTLCWQEKLTWLAHEEVKTVLERSSVWRRPEGGSLRFVYIWEALQLQSFAVLWALWAIFSRDSPECLL